MSLSCGCDDGPEVFRQTEVTARKVHKCTECGKMIEPGETYTYTFYVFEGDPDQVHSCEKCKDLADSLNALGFCYSYGELHAAHQEYVHEYVQPEQRRTRIGIAPNNQTLTEAT